jgi:4-hydroxythreonine-4-phosphate dehydrogenase
MVMKIGITLGDPSGIGPEVVIKSLQSLQDAKIRHATISNNEPSSFDSLSDAAFVIFGDVTVFLAAYYLVGATFKFHISDRLEHSLEDNQLVESDVSASLSITLIAVTAIAESDFFKQPYSDVSGLCAYQYISAAIIAYDKQMIDTLVTAPISKAALNKAHIHYPGHTEMLAALTHSSQVAMMFVAQDLRVVLTTTHQSLLSVILGLSIEQILKTLRIAQQGLASIGIAHPKIAVAGINPHAGENGIFGQEEIEVITPAIDLARSAGINAFGPIAADTVFWRAMQGEFDCVIAHYHDQGLIPVKLLGLDRAVNVTIGLPFIRTSPDHGTAHDIAWQGVAHATPMLEAIRLAHQLTQHTAAHQDESLV